VQLTLNEETCTHCGVCTGVCKMGVDPSVHPGDPECIRCNDCVAICPVHALSLGLPSGQRKQRTVTN